MMKRICISALCLGIVLSAFGWDRVPGALYTEWAKNVTPENVHPEYPRPQMFRSSWQSLNGLWSYAVSDIEAQAMDQPEGEILVPFVIEAPLSGVGRELEPYESLWYRRKFSVPAEWKGKNVLLHFDAVDWDCTVWLNGTLIGNHKGGYTAFSFDVTPALKADGEQELTVKVIDQTENDFGMVGKQSMQAENMYHFGRCSGIWQSVWMEAVSSKAYIEDYEVSSDIDKKLLCVHPEVQGQASVKVELLKPAINYSTEKPGTKVIDTKVINAGETAEFTLKSPKLWSPDTPYLYGIRITALKDGEETDKVEAYTAMRKISVMTGEDGWKRFTLNNRPLFHLGVLDQGWWPDGLYTAPSEEALLFDVEVTKEYSFNVIRKHLKVEPARWYYHCDRLGIMVWQDIPNFARHNKVNKWPKKQVTYGEGTLYPASEAVKENFRRELTEIVAQLSKFQCIAVWVPFNEAMGQFDTGKIVNYVRSLDPTRLINGASGGNFVKGELGDILDVHHYPEGWQTFADKDLVNVIGEFGGKASPIKGHTWRNVGMDWNNPKPPEQVTNDYEYFVRNLKDEVKKGCAGAIYAQFSDINGELSGIVTYDRAVVKINQTRATNINLKTVELFAEYY